VDHYPAGTFAAICERVFVHKFELVKNTM